ncbi:MAG: helix-turn-helix transcriptional regulator [Eubacteriales bacterium]|nr:helix-turn-helix transcriptional regulator [Eubacteriales bacterium]
MKVRYDKLWKLALDNKMNKHGLARAAEVSTNTIAKLGKSELVSMEVMLKLCKVFHCDIGDLMEVIEED